MMIDLGNSQWVSVDKIESVRVRPNGSVAVGTASGDDFATRRDAKEIVKEINELTQPVSYALFRG